MERQRTCVALFTLGLLLALSLARVLSQAQAHLLPAADLGAPASQFDGGLLIVTPRVFEPTLAPLVAHKNATGIPTTLMTLEEIYGNPNLTGDEAAKVKQAIALKRQQSGINYVMLVGDVDRFPVRWVAFINGDMVEYFYPSDLYYADLYESDGVTFETWDSDDDGLYAEHGSGSDPDSVNLDRLDFHPDVAVGRVPASTIEQLESYVAKVIRYEYLTYGSDWFHNVLLIAGDGRGDSRYCDPGINFSRIQTGLESAFGDVFAHRTWIYNRYYADEGDESGRPCVCQADESLTDCLRRTRLPNQAAVDVFTSATVWTDTLDVTTAEFEDVGLLGWHDHTQPETLADYTRVVTNADRFSVAFADGCGDGRFAGWEIGCPERLRDPYRTTDGHSLQVLSREVWIGGNRYYHIDDCVLDGSPHGLDGTHCGDGIYPAMTFADDFGLDPSATVPVLRTDPYVRNLPPPELLQVQDYDWHPEGKLFAKWAATSKETGWIGMVGAAKGAWFPENGEFLELFFEGYADPHGSVDGRRGLGDAWRSMLERWLEIMFNASGGFSFDHISNVYGVDRRDSGGEYIGVQYALMQNLFGDPSLRIGGLNVPVDTVPPMTSDDTDGAWHNRNVTVRLTAVDRGLPPPGTPSGVRTTRYSVDANSESTGTRLTVEAPSDHSNDGLIDIAYHSVDFLDNWEATEHAQVKIDTVPPHTEAYLDGEPVGALSRPGAVRVTTGPEARLASDALQGFLMYPQGSTPPERGCYNSSVEVELGATDDRSGPDRTLYVVDGASVQQYTGPFPLGASYYVTPHSVDYWSTDNAGNGEHPHRLRVCVTDFRAGMMKEKLRILAALEEIVAMRMRQDLASSLPPIASVDFEHRFTGDPQPYWAPIGTDMSGNDGWSVDWVTTQAQNGPHDIRMTAWGPPGTQAAQPAPEPVYQEVVHVIVSNLPGSAYAFNLNALPAALDGGETVSYILEFVNATQGTLTNLTVKSDLDPGFFEQIQVLDGGYLDPAGMPTWDVAAVQPGETLKLHFDATTRPDVVPGTVIATQAFLVADTIPQLLSDDPSTPEDADWTAVTINLVDGEIDGYVADATHGTPISASVTVAGPVSRTVTTDNAGHYAALGLPPGAYTVSVEAHDYAYYTPAGPVAVTLDGIAQNVQVGFDLTRADTMAPVSTLHRSADDIVLSHATVISGTSYDYPPGSGVQKVELSIYRADDDKYWGGESWVLGEKWLLASGTTAWAADCGSITWENGLSYAIRARATDNADNVEIPVISETTADLQAPSPIAPVDGSLVDDPPTFKWSLVLDSRYRLQVDDDHDFRSPEIDTSEIDFGFYTPRHLAAGSYSWRVQAVDARLGYPESEWSEVWTLRISAPIYLPLVLKKHTP